MIAKKYRLSEREVKKVLSKGKPFFSYSLVFKHFPSKLPHARCAIVISGKSCKTAVLRNLYRRAFYDCMRNYLHQKSGDIVCVVSTKQRLDADPKNIKKIHSEWKYILDKKLGRNT